MVTSCVISLQAGTSSLTIYKAWVTKNKARARNSGREIWSTWIPLLWSWMAPKDLGAYVRCTSTQWIVEQEKKERTTTHWSKSYPQRKGGYSNGCSSVHFKDPKEIQSPSQIKIVGRKWGLGHGLWNPIRLVTSQHSLVPIRCDLFIDKVLCGVWKLTQNYYHNVCRLVTSRYLSSSAEHLQVTAGSNGALLGGSRFVTRDLVKIHWNCTFST